MSCETNSFYLQAACDTSVARNTHHGTYIRVTGYDLVKDTMYTLVGDPLG